MISKDKTVGLALSGGAALGGAHVGVLRALKEFGVKIDYISGTSVGALVGSLYAFNNDIDELEKSASSLSWRSISKLSITSFALFSNVKMKSFIKDYIGNVNLEDSPIPLSVIATDITNGEKVVLEEGSVADAVLASTCIPAVFKPILHDGRMLVDGGIVENVPVSPLEAKKADIIIAVDLNAKQGRNKPGNIFDVMVNSFHFTLANASKAQHVAADILITPNLINFNVVNTDQTPKLIEAGYKEAVKVLSEIEEAF